MKPHLAFVPVAGENVLVRGPGVFLRYSGEAVPALLKLLPLLDGTRDADALAKGTGLALSDVVDLVEGLRADRLVEDAGEDEPLRAPAPAPQLALWSYLGAHPQRAQNRISLARVLVEGPGEVADAVAEGLARAGVGGVARSPSEDGAAFTHVVVALDAPDAERLIAANERLLAARVPFTVAVLNGVEASIGPTVVPGQTACWRCYDLRAKGAHPNVDRLLAYEAARAPVAVSPTLPSFAPIVGAWTAQAVLVALAQTSIPPLAGYVAHVALLDLDARRHRVLRIPRCPACSRGDVPDVDRYALEGGIL